MMMTIRRCIEEMRKLGMGINKVILNNGTAIYINEIDQQPDSRYRIGTFKWNEDGTLKAIRNIFCRIEDSKYTKGLEELKHNNNYYLYDTNLTPEENWFFDNEFCIPERIMNQFISLNGGIDEYYTLSTPYYMIADTMMLMDDNK